MKLPNNSNRVPPSNWQPQCSGKIHANPNNHVKKNIRNSVMQS